MVSAQQTNLLPENASWSDTTFSKSLYHIYQTTSQCCSSYGCAITVQYTLRMYILFTYITSYVSFPHPCSRYNHICEQTVFWQHQDYIRTAPIFNFATDPYVLTEYCSVLLFWVWVHVIWNGNGFCRRCLSNAKGLRMGKKQHQKDKMYVTLVCYSPIHVDRTGSYQ